MVDETGLEVIYPSGEMDIKRRVAGEVLRFFENLDGLPQDDYVAELIENVFTAIRISHWERIQTGRPINIPEEVKKYLVKIV
ncbi:MAG: hypothetical protein JXK94_02925 [Deltaproteobacteria bacterium]|nr:hypothetical protein [Deltaproteobacteria bacterium]